MNYPINIYHVLHTLSLSSGGTSRVVVDLSNSMSKVNSINVGVVAQQFDGEKYLDLNPSVQKHIGNTKSKLGYYLGVAGRNKLSELNLCKDSIIHSHGLWLPINHWAKKNAKAKHSALVVQPHGMLEPWALNYKSWKKKLAMYLFQKKDIKSADVIVATSRSEYQNIRELGYCNPIAIIPNGIALSSNKVINLELKTERQTKVALFLSRVHPKKGLLNLIKAWSHVDPVGWRLQIAGPDESGHMEEVMAEARRCGIEDKVDYLGEVDGYEKTTTYKNADLFILPTYSENFGVVIVEALSNGVPVITTKGAPWQDLNIYQCGWWIDIGVEPLIAAINNAISLDDDELIEMGIRGVNYVQRYDWEIITQQTLDMYSWLLGNIPKPDYIHLD